MPKLHSSKVFKIKQVENRSEESKERHRVKCRERITKRRADRIENGLCTYCGEEREDKDYQLCIKCRDKKVRNDHNNMERGLCRNCGGSREDLTVNHCNKCREAQRTTKLKQLYNISNEDYDRMFNEQNGVCWICKKTEVDKTLHIDHDKESGRVRGLLCGNCNRGIGCLSHSRELLQQAIKYLEEFS